MRQSNHYISPFITRFYIIGSLLPQATISVPIGSLQTLTNQSLSSSSIIATHYCLSRSKLHPISNWIRGGTLPLSKSLNVSTRLGQPFSLQIDCMLSLQLEEGGGLVTLR